nr:TSUP family transporter [Aliamphritea spongicola]
MTEAELLLLFAAGIISGMLNAVAGGGSFISFPALLFAGVPPISANATNTFAACSGYLSGTWAFRHDLKAHKNSYRCMLPSAWLAV